MGGFFMQGLLGQLTQQMAQGVPTLGQVGSSSPNFDPGLQPPPQTQLPSKSPITDMPLAALHRAFERRGMQKPAQLAQAPQLPQAAPQAPQAPSAQQTPQVSEAQAIIDALSKRLAHRTNMEKHITKALIPQPDFSESPTAGASATLK